MGEREDELVEEEDHGVVAEALGVPAQDAEAVIEVDVGAHAVDRLEPALGQHREELAPPGAVAAGDRGLEARAIPAVDELAPAVCGRRACIERREEFRFTELIEQRTRVREELLVGEERRHAHLEMMLLNVREISAEDRGVDALLPDHVEWSSRSFARPANACLSRNACSSGFLQAASWPLESRLSMAMKCDLPLPNEPCR